MINGHETSETSDRNRENDQQTIALNISLGDGAVLDRDSETFEPPVSGRTTVRFSVLWLRQSFCLLIEHRAGFLM